MQRSPRGNPNLSPGFPQQNSLPRVQTEIRTADSQRDPQGIHGREESLREDDRGAGAGPRPLQDRSVQDLLQSRRVGSPGGGARPEDHGPRGQVPGLLPWSAG